MKEHEFNVAIRITALENVVVMLARLVYELNGLSPETIRELHAKMVDAQARLRPTGFDPAMADHVAAEMEDAVRQMVKAIEGAKLSLRD